MTGLIIRARKLDDSSDYKITLEVISSQSGSSVLITILTVIILFTGIVLFGLGVAVFVWIKYKAWKREEQAILERVRRERSEAYRVSIDHVISNMTNDLFENIHNDYEQQTCVVCLELFDAASEVCVTNECGHVFHKSCLKAWYENIPLFKPLICPHCNTTNTNNSVKMTKTDRVDLRDLILSFEDDGVNRAMSTFRHFEIRTLENVETNQEIHSS